MNQWNLVEHSFDTNEIRITYCLPIDECRAMLRRIKAAVKRILFVNGPSFPLFFKQEIKTRNKDIVFSSDFSIKVNWPLDHRRNWLAYVYGQLTKQHPEHNQPFLYLLLVLLLSLLLLLLLLLLSVGALHLDLDLPLSV